MTRAERPLYEFQSKPITPIVARTIKRFSKNRRNAVRGAVAEARRGDLGSEKIDAFRNNVAETDMLAAAIILESPGGLRNRSVNGLVQHDLTMTHHLKANTANLEATYACGFLNAWKKEATEAISTIADLSRLTQVPPKDVVGPLRKAVEKWGASNYIARKMAYIKEFIDFDEIDQCAIEEIDGILGHRKSPAIQYATLDYIKERVSLFTIARRHTNIMADLVKNDLRRCHGLNNLVATPICHEDCAGFLLRAVESSLVDTALSFLILMNLRERFPDIVQTIKRHLAPEIHIHLLNQLQEIASAETPNLLGVVEGTAHFEDRSLSLYRRSAIFLEYPQLCFYRNDIDRVIGHRLIAPIIPNITSWHSESFYSPETLRRSDDIFDISLHNSSSVKIDTFYRTYLFLRFIQDQRNLAMLTGDDIQYVFDNTMRLEILLLERELKTMHINASDEARALISVLALALYRSKSSDPDVDFDFRAQLENFILMNFAGNIASFIDQLAPSSPEVANYIATSLDEVTLQKMYSIISSPLAAENARREILTSVGVHLNKIEYIIEAEAIETRSKVAKLKDYFDASRMFVDSMAMIKWLSSNPSAYIEQYKELLPKITARFSTSVIDETKIAVFEIMSTDRYIVEQMAGSAFREFCINNEFGIESYLGRRIRHNTLQGVMTKIVDAVLQRPEYHHIIAGTPFGNALRTWENNYKIFIERIRREFLQFRSESKPNALFNSEIDLGDPATRGNLQQLVYTVLLSGPEMLDEMIISFCWRQIAPQLETASRHIRVKMAQEITQSLDQTLQRFNGPEEQKIKSALADGITSVFAQVASWFNVPQTGFVPASISEICNIIDIEHGRSASSTIVAGDRLSTKYYGISVHRLYDCLAVLLQNAFKHGKRGSDVTVKMTSSPIEATNLHILDVSVRSILSEIEAVYCITRVEAAITSSETGRDMVTEGYSGLKKVKFITRLNEGTSTVSYKITGEAIEISFRMKAEVASGENGHENTLS